MVWTLHGEKADGSGGASGVNQDPVRALVASSVVAPEVSDDCSHDYITVEDIQDMGDDGDDGVNVEEATVQEAKDVRLFEDLVNHIDEDDVVFGCPKWLENFREIKKASCDPLYQDGGSCLKECTTLRFNLQMLILKARHGWSGTNFNERLSLLATTYPTPNNALANTNRAKKLIRPVVINLGSSMPALTTASYIEARSTRT
jgi:hypothetical protein